MNALENCMFSAQCDIICKRNVWQKSDHKVSKTITEHFSPGHAYVDIAKKQVSQAQELVDKKVATN